MCFPHDARPPITPISGAAVDSEDLVLTSKDGTKFAAFVARSENPSGAGMVILPDVRGLGPCRPYGSTLMRCFERARLPASSVAVTVAVALAFQP